MPEDKVIHILQLTIVAILCFAVIAFVFGVGVFVGQKRAEFSFQFASNYHRNFAGPEQGLFGNYITKDFISGHGVYGAVMEIEGDMLFVIGQDNMEKTVVISSATTIMQNKMAVAASDIKINDSIVVIGSPDDQGRIQAKFIRILPENSTVFFRKNGGVMVISPYPVIKKQPATI